MTGRPLVVVGATASGKSALALAIARARPAGEVELVTADSMQVYRGMDIGTAKPTDAEQAEVRHHLLDLVDPGEDYSVARFQADARRALDDIAARGKRAIVVGGTGLYVRSLVDGLTIPGQWPDVRAELDQEPDTAALHRRLHDLDPVAAGRMEPGNRRRIVRALEVTVGSGRPFSTFGPGLEAYPAEVRFHLVGLPRPDPAAISDRFHRMLGAGLLDEVRSLATKTLGRTARQALGYKELLHHVEDGAPLDECIDEAIRRTRKFARRQEAWFRRDPRIRWLEFGATPDEVLGDWTDR